MERAFTEYADGARTSPMLEESYTRYVKGKIQRGEVNRDLARSVRTMAKGRPGLKALAEEVRMVDLERRHPMLAKLGVWSTRDKKSHTI